MPSSPPSSLCFPSISKSLDAMRWEMPLAKAAGGRSHPGPTINHASHTTLASSVTAVPAAAPPPALAADRTPPYPNRHWRRGRRSPTMGCPCGSRWTRTSPSLGRRSRWRSTGKESMATIPESDLELEKACLLSLASDFGFDEDTSKRCLDCLITLYGEDGEDFITVEHCGDDYLAALSESMADQEDWDNLQAMDVEGCGAVEVGGCRSEDEDEDDDPKDRDFFDDAPDEILGSHGEGPNSGCEILSRGFHGYVFLKKKFLFLVVNNSNAI